MADFIFTTTPEIQLQRGAAARLGELLAVRAVRRVLIVTDAGLRRAGLLDPALASIAKAGIEAAVYDEVVADPPEDIVAAALAHARTHRADAIVGFGGGSSMDVAKLVALLARTPQALAEMYGIGLARGPRLPLIQIPTTAGTGSEVTPIAIVTTGATEKKGVVAPVLLPDLALLDPELTRGLPQHVTAATGIDAMVHAIEAYTSRHKKNPLSDALAREALRLLSGAIERASLQGDDLDARSDMLLGACFAGMAFANAPVAAVHALAYPIGGRFHVPHGLSNALVLPHVLRFNLGGGTKHYDELAPIFGATDGAGLVTRLEQLADRLSVPKRLRDVGISHNELPLLAEDAMRQTRLLVNNPRDVTIDDARAIYEAAY
ncbi:iron-containing alcohol dehydrogenase [Roseiterribacter gracilis]|uniref:Alcohol dehydrogenase 2 n=1 Tax=Roseiterribacter gracilis TaxID=2812848 RepID=A0A8S8X982_9PROT|nr:iron-containing alcohol dehydrogenase [Rhodospirillales bacterium TMPK1]